MAHQCRIYNDNYRDNVQWDAEQEELALKKVSENSERKFSDQDREKFEKEADKYWDKFYTIHQNRFFKDRHWLFTEFPELDIDKNFQKQGDKTTVFEIGCGVGNTIFPILQNTSNRNFFLYGCDFSKTAIELFKEHPLYDESCCLGFQFDVTSQDWNLPFEKNTLDIVIMIFVLSAINPEKYE